MRTLLLLIFFFVASFCLNAQTTTVNYQSYVRDNMGNPLLNQMIGVQLSIRKSTSNGSIVYQETHSTTTSDRGLISLALGGGSVVSGDFTSIEWTANPHFLEIAMDLAGGNSYSVIGTPEEIKAVPFALSTFQDPSAFSTTSNVTSNQPGNPNTDDFVFGSLDLDDNNGIATDNSRLYFDKSKGAFRAGSVDNAQWNTANSGNQSAAFGSNTQASGNGSFAAGIGTTAESLGQAAFGLYNTPSTGDSGNYVSTDPLFVIGNGTDAVNTSNAVEVLKDGSTTINGGTTINGVATVNGTAVVNSSTPSLILNSTNSQLSVIDFQDLTNSRIQMYYNPPNDLFSIYHAGKGADVFSIEPSGDVGLGTTTPLSKLHIEATDDTGDIRLEDTNPYVDLIGETSSANSGLTFREVVAGHTIKYGELYHRGTDNTIILDNSGNGITEVAVKNGQVGIGTDNPSYTLHVLHGNGAGSNGLAISDGSAPWSLYENAASAFSLQLYFGGQLRGSFNRISGTYSAISDASKKTNITHLDGKEILKKIKKLQARSYNFTTQEDSKLYYGFLAQEVEKLFPSAVAYDVDSNTRTLDYSLFGVLAVSAIKEQQKIIDKQQKDYEALLKRVEALEAKVN